MWFSLNVCGAQTSPLNKNISHVGLECTSLILCKDPISK
jgi:hypothetical protein